MNPSGNRNQAARPKSVISSAVSISHGGRCRAHAPAVVSMRNIEATTTAITSAIAIKPPPLQRGGRARGARPRTTIQRERLVAMSCASAPRPARPIGGKEVRGAAPLLVLMSLPVRE